MAKSLTPHFSLRYSRVYWMCRSRDSVLGIFLSVSTQPVAVTSQRPSAMRALMRSINSGSYSSTILYTLAWDWEKQKSGYWSIRFNMVRKVARVTATVSLKLHIQFMSMWAWAARISWYSLASFSMGASISSALAQRALVKVPSSFTADSR